MRTSAPHVCHVVTPPNPAPASPPFAPPFPVAARPPSPPSPPRLLHHLAHFAQLRSAVILAAAIARPDGDAEHKGTWKVLLPPQPTSKGGYMVSAICADCANRSSMVSIAEVSFGEVWVCSGQSNSEGHA